MKSKLFNILKGKQILPRCDFKHAARYCLFYVNMQDKYVYM